MAKPQAIPCHHCKGAGVIEFTGKYADTLKRIKGLRGEFTAVDLAGVFDDVQATAVNNRLARLEELGFLSSRRYGRKRLFWVKWGGK